MSNPKQPTWAEYTKLEREKYRLAAKVNTLMQEVRDFANVERERAKMQALHREASDKLEARTRENRDLEVRLGQSQRRVLELERENGEIEARLARALGRTFVVSKSDEIAGLVAGLVQIREWCSASIDRLVPRLVFGQPPDPSIARLRQISAHVAHVLRQSGVTEEQREPAKAVGNGAPHTT